MTTQIMMLPGKKTSPATPAHVLRGRRMKPILVALLMAASVIIPHRVLAAEPAIDNATGASDVLSISAVLNGTLTATGGAPTQVSVYWGETDGNTTFANWGRTNDLGVNPVGPLSLEVSYLWPNRIYYYRFYATNPDGEAWASATTKFQTLAAVGPAPIDLGSCSNFTILAGTTISTTGGGMINGDVGLYPAGSVGIPPEQVNGTIYNGGPIAAQAQLDLTEAFNAASPAQLSGGINVGDGELGGRVLTPGVYQSAPGSYGITLDDLTLHGGPNDVWVFQMASTLTVGTGRRVILTGGAQVKNIFWQVGSSATLQTSSDFKGTIMASASITMDTGSTMQGRALAQSGAVTFNGDGGSLPSEPQPPLFTHISATTDFDSATVVIETTPYFLLTLQACPDLSLTNWTTIATDSPVAAGSSRFIDNTPMAGATQRFYRAFITP